MTDRSIPCCLLAFVATLGIASGAVAGPIPEELAASDAWTDLRAMGSAGATVGRARGVNALLTNPAGMGAGPGSEFAASGVYTDGSVGSEVWNLGPRDADTTSLRLGALGLVYDTRTARHLAIGIAYSEVRDLDTRSIVEGVERSGDYSGFRVVEASDTQGKVSSLTLGAGFEVAPGVHVGIASDLWDGRRDRDITFDGDDVSGSDAYYQRVTYDDTISRSISGARLRVGGELAASPALSVGAYVVLPSEIDVREDWAQLSSYRFDDGTRDQDGDSGITDYTLHLPAELHGGVTVRAFPFTLSAAVRRVDWEEAYYAPSPARDVDARQFARYYQPTVDASASAEVDLGGGAALRAGIQFGMLPQTWVDVRQEPVTMTAGLSVPIAPRVKLDAAYAVTFSEGVESDVTRATTRQRVGVGVRAAL
ncbi:hypothetical protein FJZ36_14295 [Candidatus Poribacteria bacterium]|nr:hypothetical protein [Candidatus Poribacteria bacterium]